MDVPGGEMEFRTLTKRIAEALNVEPPVIAEPAAPEAGRGRSRTGRPFDPEKYERVSDMAALEAWIAKIPALGYVAIDTETTGLNEMQAELVGICLSGRSGRGLPTSR